MNNEIQYPLADAASRVRRGLKILLGGLLCRVFRRRRAQLLAGDVGERLGFRDRAMIASLRHRHERLGTLDRLGKLQDWLWQGGQAVAFHRQAEARFQTWWIDGASASVAPLRELVLAHPRRFSTLCEIGCGSGLVLRDVSQRIPEVLHWVGLDLSPEQTELNRTRFAGSGLRFEAGNACQWIPAQAGPGWIYFTNAGVFEYFPEAAMRALLESIAREKAPAALAIAEPLDEDFDPELAPHSRPFGRERTFSHPYPRLLTECGWTLRWSQFGRIEGFRFLYALATTGLESAPESGNPSGSSGT